MEGENLIMYGRGAQPFWAKGRIELFFVHSMAEDKTELNFRESSIKNQKIFSLFN